MKNGFRIGDVVRSADGIPMTVEREAHEYEGRAWVPCVWFNGLDEIRRGHFDEGSLVKVAAAYGGMAKLHVPKVPVTDELPPAKDINAAIQMAAATVQARMDALETGGGTIHPSILNRAELGQALYKAYGDQAGGKNFLGQPMPAWEDLPDHIRDCWEAVGTAAIRIIRTERR